MPALKILNPALYGPTKAAWGRWMKERIYNRQASKEDLDSIPEDPGAWYALGRLPPGYHWGDDYEVISDA